MRRTTHLTTISHATEKCLHPLTPLFFSWRAYWKGWQCTLRDAIAHRNLPASRSVCLGHALEKPATRPQTQQQQQQRKIVGKEKDMLGARDHVYLPSYFADTALFATRHAAAAALSSTETAGENKASEERNTAAGSASQPMERPANLTASTGTGRTMTTTMARTMARAAQANATLVRMQAPATTGTTAGTMAATMCRAALRAS